MIRRLLLLLPLLLGGGALAQPPGLGAEGGELRLVLPDGRVLRGEALAGAVLHFDGLDLRIEAARRDAAVPLPGGGRAGDVWLFRLSARQPGRDWSEVCEPDPAGERHALLLPAEGGGFGLTCSAGAVGKCIRLGYRPWASLAGVGSLAPFHEACVNLLRGAYGGPDRAWTRDGMRVDVFDRIGIQVPEDDPADSFEAGWTAEGAVCLAHPRVPGNGPVEAIGAAVPRLAGRLGPEDCTEARAAALGALVFNRSRRH